MKRIVIIGANSFQNPLILKAKQMGYETHVFAWREGAVGEKNADFFYPISIREKEAILEECRKINPDAVVTIASDLAVITVQYVAERLGLICNSAYNIDVATNKYEMRRAFKEASITVPKFFEVGLGENLDEAKNMSYPLIVKPTDRSGSRAITKVESFEEIENAVAEAIANSFENKAIIEEYMEGDEFSCECISYEGRHELLAVTKKFTTGAPHFIETGHLEPSGLTDAIIEDIRTNVFKALDALDITYGASHTEFKIDSERGIRIIEIGPRMGGDCIGSDLVQISTGYDFVKMTLQVALGEKPDMKKVVTPKVAAIKFIFTQEDYEHLKRIKKEYPEKIHFISDIAINREVIVDSSSRYGYYILACDSIEEAVKLGDLCIQKKE